MSLSKALGRLSLRPPVVSHQCCRTVSSSAAHQQSATVSLVDAFDRARAPTSPPSRSADASYEMAKGIVQQASMGRLERGKRKQQADLKRGYTARDLDSQISRRWKAGHVYAPHDLTGVEMSKWKKLRMKPKPKFDVTDQLAMNPLHHYKNFSIMSEYISEMGRIKHSNETRLRPVNQRKMAKAIRRAMGTGILMPGVHRHPELLRMESEALGRHQQRR